MSEIIWQSKRFPELVLTKEHLELLKENYPEVKHFQPEMKKMELWLHDHPNRRPQKNWKRFITNWIGNVKRFQENQLPQRKEYGDSARELATTPKQFGEIMKKIQGDR